MDIDAVETTDERVDRIVWAMLVRVTFGVVGEAFAVALICRFVEVPP